MKFYSYIIASKKPFLKTYVGWTNNLKKRLECHNSGKGAKATRGRKWSIVYYLSFNSKRKAMVGEYELKKNKELRKEIRLKITHNEE